jgi:hypothetical protein
MRYDLFEWVEMAEDRVRVGFVFSVFERLGEAVQITRALQWFVLPPHLCLIFVTDV